LSIYRPCSKLSGWPAHIDQLRRLAGKKARAGVPFEIKYKE
jgi:hypothetical protein